MTNRSLFTVLTFSLLTAAACDPAASEPSLELTPRAAKSPDVGGVLAAEHLAELHFDEGDVTIDGNEAEVTAYLHVVNRTDGSFLGSSVIHDRLVRTSEGWRFESRSVAPDQLPGG